MPSASPWMFRYPTRTSPTGSTATGTLAPTRRSSGVAGRWRARWSPRRPTSRWSCGWLPSATTRWTGATTRRAVRPVTCSCDTIRKSPGLPGLIQWRRRESNGNVGQSEYQCGARTWPSRPKKQAQFDFRPVPSRPVLCRSLLQSRGNLTATRSSVSVPLNDHHRPTAPREPGQPCPRPIPKARRAAALPSSTYSSRNPRHTNPETGLPLSAAWGRISTMLSFRCLVHPSAP